MSLTIVGRMNLSASPTMPAMVQEGVLAYKATNTALRVATFGGADVLLTNACPNFNQGRSACILNNFYCYHQSYVGAFIASPLVNVDLSSGAVWSGTNVPDASQGVVRPRSATSIGVMNRAGVGNDQATWATLGANGVTVSPSLWPVGVHGGGATDFPPTAGPYWHDPVTFRHYQTYGQEVFTVGFVGAPNRAVLTSITVETVHGANTVLYNGQSNGYPGVWFSDGTYFYGFALEGTVSTLVTYRLLMAGGSSDFVYGGPAFALNGGYDTLAGSTLFGRLAFAHGGGNQYRLYSSPTWPIAFGNNIALDTPGAGGIMGVWIFEPHIYVAKQAGATFGAQLIKIYDSDLTGRKRGRRHWGGELWDVIPEVAPYLG